MRRLQLHFPTSSAYEHELEKNILKGGAFVETEDSYKLREQVEVEVKLDFCGQSVVLGAEVVNCVSPNLVPVGGRAGVAVQFTDTVHKIRQILKDISGVDAISDPEADLDQDPIVSEDT